MTDLALTRSEKVQALLVEFSFGDESSPTIYRFTDAKVALSYLGQVFSPTPEMEIEIPAYTGGLNEQPFAITLPLNAFTAALSFGEPHAPVSLLVREFFKTDIEGSADVIFQGQAHRTIRNFEGDRERVRIESVNAKSRLGVTLGIPSNPQCVWTLFGPGCGLPEVPQIGTISAVDKATITSNGLVFPRDAYFQRGWIQIDGLRMGIRSHQGTDTTMILVRQPPRWWLDRTATFVPGCQKTIEACRDWGNEENFCGPGYAIPEYHPVVESQ